MINPIVFNITLIVGTFVRNPLIIELTILSHAVIIEVEKGGTPIDGAPSYTKLSEKITAKFGRLGGYFLLLK